MVDDAFWRRKAIEFEEAVVGESQPIRADYTSDVWTDDWVRRVDDSTIAVAELLYETRPRYPEPEKHWQLEGPLEAIDAFKDVAASVAVGLGYPDGQHVWAYWLEILRQYSVDFSMPWGGQRGPNTRSTSFPERPDRITRAVENPDVSQEYIAVEGGEINDVCKASARFCRKLANEIERVRLSGQPLNQQVNPFPSQRPAPDGLRSESTIDLPTSSRPTKEALSIQDVAKLLSVSEDTIRRRVKSGKIKAIRVGRLWRIPKDEIKRIRTERHV